MAGTAGKATVGGRGWGKVLDAQRRVDERAQRQLAQVSPEKLEEALERYAGWIREYGGGRQLSQEEFTRLCAQFSDIAILALVLMLRGPDAKLVVESSKYLLDRVYGRPTERISGDPTGAPIVVQGFTEQQFQMLAARIILSERKEEPETEMGILVSRNG